MQAKMRELFSAAGKELKFWKAKNPGRWIILVDGKALSDCYSDEAKSFQTALDKSCIVGKISYTYSEKKGEWVFKYTPKKEA